MSAPRLKVLIVDDEALLMRAMAFVLRELDVETASGGREALERLTKSRFDVVVTDLNMPGLSGLELMDAIERLDPGLARRVVLTTGGTCSSEIRRIIEARRCRCLQKPFGTEELKDAIFSVAPPRALAA